MANHDSTEPTEGQPEPKGDRTNRLTAIGLLQALLLAAFHELRGWSLFLVAIADVAMIAAAWCCTFQEMSSTLRKPVDLARAAWSSASVVARGALGLVLLALTAAAFEFSGTPTVPSPTTAAAVVAFDALAVATIDLTVTADSSIQLDPEATKAALTLKNTTTGNSYSGVPTWQPRGQSDPANQLNGQVKIPTWRRDGSRSFWGWYEVEGAVRLVDGHSISVSCEPIHVAYQNDFVGVPPDAIDMDQKHWSVVNDGLEGDVSGPRTRSTAMIADTLYARPSFELSGRAEVRLQGRDQSASTNGTRAGIGIALGSLVTVVFANGFEDAVSVLVGEEEAAPSSPQVNDLNSWRTGQPIPFGQPFSFRIQKHSTQAGFEITVWINDSKVATRGIDVDGEGSRTWRIGIIAFEGFVRLDFVRVDYDKPSRFID